MLLIGLFFGTGIGVVVAAGNDLSLTGHDHSDPTHHGGTDHAAMHVETVEAPDGLGLSVEATPDPVGGYNLHLDAPNFTFAPGSASGPHVPGEGHAHVYMDGVKLGRFYGPWIHVPSDGEVSVTLNANDHRAYTRGGKPLAAALRLD
ncbi:hypothetical protein PAA8504_00812 [Palleronia abyssalis]|uniref:DUF4399 domain-containing protein n=2 Tax=Palleronia abyssalis TaxID=1501240 RepID=A0A2R8BS90_9RHOB|nr:hypothetical protein PAA8504_00812 [Palleronia abyssalis]